MRGASSLKKEARRGRNTGTAAPLTSTRRMAIEYSELELALNTLVSGFYSESKNGSNMLNSAEFQTLVSTQLPTLAKTVGEDGGLQKLLKQMGVEEGQDITFSNFWTLVQKQASDQFSLGINEKSARCGCSVC